jgi:hypothetical protein
VSFDVGDNGLRPPFRDQKAGEIHVRHRRTLRDRLPASRS